MTGGKCRLNVHRASATPAEFRNLQSSPFSDVKELCIGGSRVADSIPISLQKRLSNEAETHSISETVLSWHHQADCLDPLLLLPYFPYLCFVVVLFCFILLRQGLTTYLWLVWSLLCRLGYPQTHRDPNSACISISSIGTKSMQYCTWPLSVVFLAVGSTTNDGYLVWTFTLCLVSFVTSPSWLSL